jgi:L-ascorbate metabolism protein UlaG (beta-lactamase superfamily)
MIEKLKFENSQTHSFTSNPSLETVWERWPGTPLDKNGLYMNHHQAMTSGWREVWKWQTSAKPFAEQKKKDTFRLKSENCEAFLSSKADGLVWLGHASYLIRISGKLLIIDPVLQSPSFLMKRYVDLPIYVDKLKDIDYLLLSHDHRDHADKSSIQQISKQNPAISFLTGLGLKKLLHSWTSSPIIQEAGWYQKYQVTAGFEVIYVPSRHWGRRFLADTNERLWGGFIIRNQNITLYFAGDSGYGKHFAEVAEAFGKIDYAMIGIGAYEPQWFMSPSHTSPEAGFRAFRDTKANTMLPMHYGTFDLSDEPLGEPFREIQRIKEVNKANIEVLNVGQIIYF